MNAGPPARWLRTHSAGPASVWLYAAGPRFLVEMHCHGYGRHLVCWVDRALFDESDLVQGPAVGAWVHGCWSRHLESLSGHERMHYAELGLLQEAD